ncbi:MAG: laminin G domain-containing protein [Phycisphaerae bacterium]|nr:laminin G domain-containing protein [Phycisphaerae bacterium]
MYSNFRNIFAAGVLLLAIGLNLNAALVEHLTFDLDGVATVGMDATLSGGAAITVGGQGKYGDALSLDGVDGKAVISGYNGILGANPRTVSLWVKTAVNQSAGTFFIGWGDGGNGTGVRYDLGIQKETTGQLRNELNNGYGLSSATGTITDDQWHHIALTFDGTTSIFYLDGQAYGSHSTAVNTVGTVDVVIGQGVRYSNDRWCQGLIDDVRIYDNALAANDIAEIANYIPESPLPDPLVWWNMEEATGTTTADQMGLANGTINGADWITSDLASVTTGTTAALAFDSSQGDYVTTEYAGILGSNSRTITGWIKASDVQTSNAVLVSWGKNNTGQRFTFRINTTESDGAIGALRLEIQGSKVVATTPLFDNQWHHVALVMNAGDKLGDVDFYVDGQIEALSGNASPNAVIDTVAEFDVMLGTTGHSPLGYLYNGSMDDVRIYDVALTAEQIYLSAFGSQPIIYSPTPANSSGHIDPTTALSWNMFGAENAQFEINIGTDENCNDILVAHSTGLAMNYTPADDLLQCGTTYYWRVDMEVAGNDFSSSVWSFTTGGKAFGPEPDDGQVANWDDPVMKWDGDEFVASYDVYFGAVGESLTLVGNVTEKQISLVQLAEALGVSRLSQGLYEWRVDSKKTDDALLCQGDVWTVSIPEYIPSGNRVIEDFTGYADTAEMAAVWQVGGSATIELDDLKNQMLFNYNGAGQALIATGAPFDMTVDDMAEIEVNFHGSETNDPIPLYLVLSDGTNTAEIQFGSADGINDGWQHLWKVKLNEFTAQDVDVTAITSMAIKTEGTGSGTLYIIDIMLYVDRGCDIEADLNNDCKVDIVDLAVIGGDWLLASYPVNAAEPAGDNLKGWYRFENNLEDSSANGNHGAFESVNATWTADCSEGDNAIVMNADSIVNFPEGLFSDISEELTIAFWVKGQLEPTGQQFADFIAGDTFFDGNLSDRLCWPIDTTIAVFGQWNHYAFVKNIADNEMKIYCNGILLAKNIYATAAIDNANAGISSLSLYGFDTDPAILGVDDLRIYAGALAQNEIVFLAKGARGFAIQPVCLFDTTADINCDDIVDLNDWVTFTNSWLVGVTQ